MIKKALLILPCLFLGSFHAVAQDRIFTYVYQSLVLNKGEKELEVWATYLTGKEDYFRALDTRAEFEVGLGKRIQTSFYLNYSSKSMGVMEDTLAGLETENEFSFSNEWKYKISDPVADVLGSAVLGEITIGTSEVELEAKLILDKRMGRVTQALNLVFEPEWSWKPSGKEISANAEYKFEINYGLGVFAGKGFTIGAEIRNPNMAEGGEWANSALYAGPTLSYAREGFWVNLTFMPQIAGLRGISPGQGLNLDEYERYQFRLLFSYTF
jgi:hypothetical protein